MGSKSEIQWTDATWNPTTGCSKVSPGCAHCYAEALSLRRGWSKQPWTPEHAAENVIVHPERLDLPLRWRGHKRIFVNSMSDLFHELVPDEFIYRVFTVMAVAHQHIFQVLTKRPERMAHLLATFDREWQHWGTGPRFDSGRYGAELRRAHRIEEAGGIYGWPLPNVWLGTSVENQHWADVRVPLLLDTPAAVRFLSCEPLLGPLDLRPYLTRWHLTHRGGEPFYPTITVPGAGEEWAKHGGLVHVHEKVDWVITGGESGPHYRPFDPAWASAIRDQCQAAGVAFFHKQNGGRTPKAGGRELDGQTWDEFPNQKEDTR